jgi:hypothetical protein
VVVNTAISAQNFDDIRGTIHAFSDPDSTSGYLITRYLLALRKTIPAEFFRNSFFTCFTGGMKQFLEGSYVTRIDIAVDIPGIWVDHVLVSAHKQQCASIFTNRTGKIESVYIGRRTSDRYLRLYQKGPLKKVEEVLIRVEYQTRDAGSLDKIDQMKNPFANLKLYHITEPDMPAETAWFIDSARQRGVRRALSIVPKAAQKPLQDFLLAHQAPWWNPPGTAVGTLAG